MSARSSPRRRVADNRFPTGPEVRRDLTPATPWAERDRAVATHRGVSLSESDLEVLREGKEQRRADGSVKWRRFRRGTGTRLRTAVTAYSKVYGVESPLPGGDLPQEFGTMEKVRHRITHPRRVSDFEISLDELDAIAETGPWFVTIAKWAAAQEKANIDQMAADANQQVNGLFGELGRGEIPR
jgi:hypothetical protein